MSKPKLCLIGCGGIGAYHVDNWQDFTDIELAGFCDIIPERAEAFAKRTGGRAYTDFRAMYDTEKPDMVFIAIPPYCHGEIEYETIERGIPMFVEKPVSLDLKQACQIAERIEAKKLITAVGFQCRYADMNADAKAYINRHPIVMASGFRIGQVVDTWWFRERDKSGGQVVEQAIHQYDIMRMLLGEPETVYTVARQGIITQDEWPKYDIDDMTTTVITFQNGVVASFTAGVYSLGNNAWESKLVFGSRDTRMEYALLNHATVYGPGEEEKTVYKVGNNSGKCCDRTFIDAALSGDGSKILSPYADAVKSLALALATSVSARTGQPVKVSDLY